MAKSLSAPRIAEWVRWITACSKTDPTYKPKALLAVLDADGLVYLSAVLRELKISRPEQLIEAMRERDSEGGTRETSGDPKEDRASNAPADDS